MTDVPASIFATPPDEQGVGTYTSTEPDRYWEANEYVRADLVPRWQPIETAPRDGTRVDLWSVQFGRYPNASWDTIYDPPDTCGWTDANHHGSIAEAGPFTRWMPLPEPPK